MSPFRSKRRHCPHSDLRGIYGDRINRVGGWRLECRDCGAFLDGPVVLAKVRADERDRTDAKAAQ